MERREMLYLISVACSPGTIFNVCFRFSPDLMSRPSGTVGNAVNPLNKKPGSGQTQERYAADSVRADMDV